MARLVAGGFVAAHDEVGETEPGAFGAFQFAVEGDVLGFLHAHAGVGQEVQAVVGKIGDLFLGPLFGVGEVGFEVLDDGGEGGAALAVHGPQVDATDLGDAAGGGAGFQVGGGGPKPPGGILVAGALGVVAVVAGGEPVEVVLNPLLDGGLFLGIPVPGLGEELHTLDGTDEIGRAHV